MKEKPAEYYDQFYKEQPSVGAERSSLYEFLAKHLPEDKDAEILDAGCGAGIFLKICSGLGYNRLKGFDFSEEAVNLAEKNAPEALVWIDDIWNVIGKYDCIVLSEVLEHMEKDKAVIMKLLSLLKPDGFIIGSVPNQQMGPEVTESHLRVYHQNRFFDRFRLPGRHLNFDTSAHQNFIVFKFWKEVPKPDLSFVVPAFDGDHYLSKTIETLINQTHEAIEIIVVNDGSPDHTDTLMRWWTRNDSRIKYYSLKKNRGVVYARNFGNKKALASLIAVSDQDDLSMPNRAEVTLRRFKDFPKIDVLYSSYHECDVDGMPYAKYDAEPMNQQIFEKHAWRTWFHSSAAYRKKDILALPYRRYKDGWTDDYTFLYDWTKAGKNFFPEQEVLANCRRLPTGVMAQRRRDSGQNPNYRF